MPTVLTTPVVVPEKTIKVQKIDGIYIDYETNSMTVTIGDYEELDSEFPVNTTGHGVSLDELIKGEALIHFKHVFKAIRLKAREMGIMGAGVSHD